MRGNSSNSPKEKRKFNSELNHSHSLILFNDDVNAFEFVIDSLIEVCKHEPVQAEQCTFIAHHKGKCDVKIGSLAELKPMKDELIRRGLTATILINE